jgi:hypothetical protein
MAHRRLIMAQSITFVVDAVVAGFFDSSTSDRTLSGDRVVELLHSYIKARTREDGKREDHKLVRELMKSDELKAKLAEMRAALKK